MEFINILILLLIVICAAVALYLTGPRVQLDAKLQAGKIELPDDLDEYLQSREARYDDITPGVEKAIVWANRETKAETELAFVYLHGFSATRQESEPVPGNIAKRFGSNIFYARLAGNGRSDDALAQGSVNKWVNDAAEALTIAGRIGRKTVIIGCSTGATIAWWAANQDQFRDNITAMVFLSPNFGVADPRASVLLYPWGERVAKLVVGPYRESKPVSKAHAKYWTNRYPVESLLPMMGMVKLAMKYKPATCTIPIHITYSRNDNTVSADKIKQFIDALPPGCDSVELIQPPGASQHVIVGDILAPENNVSVEESVVSFLEKTLEISAQPLDHHDQ